MVYARVRLTVFFRALADSFVKLGHAWPLEFIPRTRLPRPGSRHGWAGRPRSRGGSGAENGTRGRVRSPFCLGNRAAGEYGGKKGEKMVFGGTAARWRGPRRSAGAARRKYEVADGRRRAARREYGVADGPRGQIGSEYDLENGWRGRNGVKLESATVGEGAADADRESPTVGEGATRRWRSPQPSARTPPARI